MHNPRIWKPFVFHADFFLWKSFFHVWNQQTLQAKTNARATTSSNWAMQIRLLTITDDPHLQTRQQRFNIRGQEVLRPWALPVKWPINHEPCWESLSVGLVQNRRGGKKAHMQPWCNKISLQHKIIATISQTGVWIITGIVMPRYTVAMIPWPTYEFKHTVAIPKKGEIVAFQIKTVKDKKKLHLPHWRNRDTVCLVR